MFLNIQLGCRKFFFHCFNIFEIFIAIVRQYLIVNKSKHDIWSLLYQRVPHVEVRVLLKNFRNQPYVRTIKQDCLKASLLHYVFSVDLAFKRNNHVQYILP